MLSRSIARSPSTFRVMHFNVLASSYEGGFPECPSEFRSFSYRMPRILEIIRLAAADIVSLVEVDNIDRYGPAFDELGYEFVFHKKPSADSTDGTALLWKRGSVEVLGGSDKRDGGCGVQRHVFANGTANQQVVHGMFHLVGPARSASSSLSSVLHVVATHLKAGRSQACEDTRLQQCEEILRLLEAKNNNGVTSTASIVLGDFNSCPSGNNYTPAVYKAMTSSGLNSSYASVSPNEEEVDITTCKMRDGVLIAEAIDYVFYDPKELAVVSVEAPPSKEDLLASRGLPCDKYPSDHVSLVVDFMLK